MTKLTELAETYWSTKERPTIQLSTEDIDFIVSQTKVLVIADRGLVVYLWEKFTRAMCAQKLNIRSHHWVEIFGRWLE